MKQFVLILWMVSTAALQAGETLRLEDSQDAMGTSFSIVLYGSDAFRMRAASEQAFEEVRRLERMLSNYRKESEWSEVNRDAADRPVRVPEELYNLVAACLDYSRRSEGAFDITVGPLMRVWGFYKGSGRMPHAAEIRVAMGQIGYQNIILDPKEKTIRFARKGIEMDPGGIGKGYAVDRMVEILKANGIGSALITAGGSSIYALGAPPGEKGWRLKIRNPKNHEETVQEVVLRDQSMSTSGNYEKFVKYGGKIYSHIMDPRAGYPAQGTLSVSVIAPRTIDSEAWTKPYFILGRQWTAAHKPKDFRVYFCEDRSELACAWLQ
jgi:thiamine biosynthesis lipoprotein